jgi:hypothetical protein
MKKLLFSVVFSFTSFTFIFAQNVPAYVPTNGLVGWWPFSGNAIDSSGNGNNGTVNGATLTADRNGVANSAYSFDGVNDFIISGSTGIPTSSNISISVWIKPLQNNGIAEFICLGSPSNTSWGTFAGTNWNGSPYQTMNYGRGCSGTGTSNVAVAPILNNWQNIVYVSSGVGGICQVYVNGNFIGQATNGTTGGCSSTNLYFGVDIFGPNYINCQLDDIGIWNRALTPCEIQNLYNAEISSSSITNQTACNSYTWNGNTYSQSGQYTFLSTAANGCDSTATLNLTINQPTTSTITQTACSSFSLNGQTYTQSGTYTQVRTNVAGCDSTITLNLTINQPPTASSNVSNTTFHGANDGAADLTVSGSAPFSFVWSNGTTTEDLNNVAAGTYNVTISDANGCTNIASVTVNQPPLSVIQNSLKTELKVYPNPVDKVLNVELSNFNQMIGYKLSINNSLGQSVYSQELNQAHFSIDLSSWKVAGTYFVELVDQKGNKVESKIILVK